MALLQFGDVFQNLLTLIIILGVFFFIYSAMKPGRTKEKISELISKLKWERQNGK